MALEMHAVCGCIRKSGVHTAYITALDRNWYVVPHQTLSTAVSSLRRYATDIGCRYADQVIVAMAPAAMKRSDRIVFSLKASSRCSASSARIALFVVVLQHVFLWIEMSAPSVFVWVRCFIVDGSRACRCCLARGELVKKLDFLKFIACPHNLSNSSTCITELANFWVNGRSGCLVYVEKAVSVLSSTKNLHPDWGCSSWRDTARTANRIFV